MPIFAGSTYHAPFLLQNGHLQTIYPSFLRRLSPDLYTRERIETPDDDFLDLDWSRVGSRKLAILCHGLEGNSHRPYMVGMAKALNREGWDALAWNYRSCSGEINRQLRLYHNGSIDDLDVVVKHALEGNQYQAAVLIGFSLGGNLVLVYLGSMARVLDSRIQKAAVFSVPCDLRSSALQLAKFRNSLYMDRFLRSLHEKIRQKMELMPGAINNRGFEEIKNFKQFDDRYTAPIHGFRNAEDYWTRCSSAQFIPAIRVPSLIVNAQNDPFLADGCYPVQQAAHSPCVHIEMPRSGGHVGFVQFNHDHTYWSEQRAMEFLNRDV